MDAEAQGAPREPGGGAGGPMKGAGEPVPGGADTVAAVGGPEALKRAFAGGDGNAMAHFYRGEMNRLTVWRTRMDVTTNWAIIATIGLLSLSLKHPSADSILIFNLAAICV